MMRRGRSIEVDPGQERGHELEVDLGVGDQLHQEEIEEGQERKNDTVAEADLEAKTEKKGKELGLAPGHVIEGAGAEVEAEVEVEVEVGQEVETIPVFHLI